jgi:hypothetical protein
MACDACGALGTTLNTMRDTYKTEQIQQICPACEATINKHLFKLQHASQNMVVDLMKSFLRNLAKNRRNQKPEGSTP